MQQKILTSCNSVLLPPVDPFFIRNTLASNLFLIPFTIRNHTCRVEVMLLEELVNLDVAKRDHEEVSVAKDESHKHEWMCDM